MKQEKQTVDKRITNFLYHLQPEFQLSDGVSIMQPYQDKAIRNISTTFFNKYFNDTNPRVLILAINPGRLGAGITGIPFTDPFRLQEICGIPNSFDKRKELSGGFIYEMIAAYGGTDAFYSHFLLSSLCPLGFVKEGKNVNYYDFKTLQDAATPFITDTLIKQKEMTGDKKVCICLGTGKNYAFFQKLNKQHHFFSEILPLPHPRYVLQYKRKQKEKYIQLYLEVLEKSLSF